MGGAVAVTGTVTASDMMKPAWQVAREARLAANRAALASLERDASACVGTAAVELAPQMGQRKPTPKRAKVDDEGAAQRRSSRLKGDRAALTPGIGEEEGRQRDETRHRQVAEDDGAENVEDEVMLRKIERLKALHESSGEGAYYHKNKTATYEHTWMRVRTMSSAALKRRIAVIENACGEHCIVKMRMFAEVLALAHHDELAKEAEDALERLLNLVRSTP